MGSSFTALPCGVCGEVGKHAYERTPRKGFTRRAMFSPLEAAWIEYKRKSDWHEGPGSVEGTGRLLILRHRREYPRIEGKEYTYGSIAVTVDGKYLSDTFVADPATAQRMSGQFSRYTIEIEK